MLQGVFSGKDDKCIKTASCNFQWVGECSWQADEGERPQGQDGKRETDRQRERAGKIGRLDDSNQRERHITNNVFANSSVYLLTLSINAMQVYFIVFQTRFENDI